MPGTQWALEVLAQEGFKYDSSIFPISGKRYGWPGFSQNICNINLPSGRSIIEVPLSTITIFGRTFPAAGGGYLRHFPYAVTKCIIRQIQKKRPAIVYMHPYEIDTQRRALNMEQLLPDERRKLIVFHKIQLRNRHTVDRKLTNLLSEFEFTTLKEVIEKAASSLRQVDLANST